MDLFVNRLKIAARAQGFAQVGVCRADAPTELARFRQWLEAGHDGQMSYLSDRQAAYADPNAVLDGVQSIVMLTMNYATIAPAWISPDGGTDAEDRTDAEQPTGRVSRYAWGERDYHDIIHERLKRLKQFVSSEHPAALVRGVVDTAPLLERDYARLAGLGWIGKNTMLIHREDGSWFFLAALLTDLPLPADAPFATDHCGSCRACLDACPTDAFPEPYLLDATRCISYLTIELRESIPASLREGMGSWVFGCDICQDVCPWNRKHTSALLDEFHPRDDMHPLDLHELFDLDDDSFRERFRRTPLWRAKRAGILRNAAIALGNIGSSQSIAPLRIGLADASPIVRGAAAWALGRINNADAARTLRERLELESDEEVKREIETAIDTSAHPG